MKLERYISAPIRYDSDEYIQRASIIINSSLTLSVIRIDPKLVGYDMLETAECRDGEYDWDTMRRFSTIPEFMNYYTKLATKPTRHYVELDERGWFLNDMEEGATLVVDDEDYSTLAKHKSYNGKVTLLYIATNPFDMKYFEGDTMLEAWNKFLDPWPSE